VGDSIEALVPMGDFIYEDKGDTREVYFWGAGSGITPLISLIKHILTSTELKVVLAYGNRSFDTTIFSSTIESFKEKYAERFKVWHFHTQLQIAPENTDVIEGRINSDLILKIVARADVNVIKHYICGPKGLKESVTETLCKLGTSDDRIFTEEFEISKNPTDFVNVTTEYIKINFKSVEYDLEVIKGKSILESALDAGLELPYSCQTGTCNTCKARTINGVIKMVGLSKERSDLLENECLLCCSHPVSDNVYIAI
jgi:ring-1,2-phenylacetyl-CoA epoxidase subunit PaaE